MYKEQTFRNGRWERTDATLTVAELIQVLQDLDGDKLVGLRRHGEVVGVTGYSVDKDGDIILED